MRPGPKTTLEDVKTAIIELLSRHPDGLNFNEIFRRLKEQKVLGSFSVLSNALKDLSRSKVVSYKDLEKPSYKIPKRIYTLAQDKQNILENLDFERTPPYQDIKTTEEASIDFFTNIKQPSEVAFLSVLLSQASGLSSIYEQIIEEKGNPKGTWRLLLNGFLKRVRTYMETRSEWARSGKISVKEKQELRHIKEILFQWRRMLTIYGISLQKELAKEENNSER